MQFLINQLATNKEVYNTEIDIPGVTVDKPFLLNRGSVAFSVGSPTRTTRLPVDWVYDGQGNPGTLPNRVLILLSNPERHVADLLVQYDGQGTGTLPNRVLHTFDKGIAVHRIERRNATNLLYPHVCEDTARSECETTPASKTIALGMLMTVSRKAARSRFTTIIRGYKPLLQFSWIQMTIIRRS